MAFRRWYSNIYCRYIIFNIIFLYCTHFMLNPKSKKFYVFQHVNSQTAARLVWSKNMSLYILSFFCVTMSYFCYVLVQICVTTFPPNFVLLLTQKTRWGHFRLLLIIVIISKMTSTKWEYLQLLLLCIPISHYFDGNDPFCLFESHRL